MTEAVESTETVEKQKTPAIAALIKGRAPAPIVHTIRFSELCAEMSAADIARLFGTTVGKVSDIQKYNNFKYITEDVRFTNDQLADAERYIERHPNFDEVGAQAVLDHLRSMPEATEEEAAAFLELRKSFRGQSNKTKSGEDADGGGGNRKAKADEDVVDEEAVDADDLLG